MAIYAVNINERSSAGKALLNYLLSLGVITTAKEENGRDETLKAIRDAKNGKVTHYNSFEDFEKQMYAL